MQAAGFIQAGSNQAGSNLSQYAQRYSLYEQAAQAEASIADVDLQATQRSEDRARALNQSMTAIEARRVASGLSLDSPTAMAIESQMRKDSQATASRDNATAANQRLSAMAKAKMLRQAGYDAGRLMDLKHDFSIADRISGGAVRKGWGYKG